ncbi:MAG TPA: hypothetical protein VFX50_09065, partial [Gemmatimonadales bacterium]|nr:hypothetical protein [Gemmatimonadales bacterium]
TVDRTAWVRLLIAGGTQVTVALDSMRSPSIPADSLRPLDGTVWTGTLEEGRRLGALTSVRRTPLAEQVALPMMRDLLPVLPETGARSGATWWDSTTTPQRLAGAELPVTTVTDYRAAETAGARELAITGDTRVSAKDTSATFGQPIEITASGVRQRTWLLSAGGQLVSAEGSDSVAMTLDVPSVGQTVPATQRTRFVVTRVGAAR